MDLNKILILSNSPHEHTGYGRQTRYLCGILQELGYQVGVVANHGLEGPAIHWQDIPIYGKRESMYCMDEIPHYVNHFGADAVISLYDLWYFPPDTAQRIGVPWIAMVPIEGAPIRGRLPRLLRTASYVVTYSQYGYDQLLDVSLPSTMIPHCVDTDVYRPGDNAAIRHELGLPQDKFVVTMVAMNKGTPPYRKAWVEMVRARKSLNKRHPDTTC